MTGYVIEGARVFDGEQSLGVRTVQVQGSRIVAVGALVPAGVERIDGGGATLLPGLIDAHTHADVEMLGYALQFGVTTELDLFSFPQTMDAVRRAAAERTDIADVRSSSVGMTAPGGHPTQLRGGVDDPELPTVSRPEDAAGFVDERIAEGADYIKVMNALTIEATRQALAAGVDGFTHLPAATFGLDDRGRITPGARADLLLVDGDPTSTIADTLSIREVWRSGSRTAR